MQRYFVPEENWHSNNIVITGDDVHHISRVTRSKTGDEIICNHPDGYAAMTEITSIDTNEVHASVKQWLTESSESPINITIAQGLPKSDKMETVLEKGTELGASSFIPIQSDRTVVVWDKKKTANKMRRYKKILKEASEQSHRNKIPTIQSVISIDALIKETQHYDILLFAYEEEAKTNRSRTFNELIASIEPGNSVLIVIGPEGGFSEREASMLVNNDFFPVRLGPRILRTETAALYALASISYQFEEKIISNHKKL